MINPARIGRRGILASLALAPLAGGKERPLVGGRLDLSVPWRLDGIDPHDIHDPVAALFGHAVFDTLYARSTEHAAYPALAAEMPRPTAAGRLSVRVRPGLRSSDGKPLGLRDVTWALDRARSRGALGLLEPYLPVSADETTGVLHFRGATEPVALARALSSPLTAILTRASKPSRPVATGAFTARLEGSRLLLRRNDYAARGAPYLESVLVRATPDLATALRAFEARDADVGWLGAGLHGRRKDARPLTGPVLGWVILRTGPEAAAWAAPGVAQGLLDGVPTARLAPLGLQGGGRSAPRTWTGPPTPMWVDGGSAHLVEVARTLAAAVGGPGHELEVRPIPPRELSDRRRAKRYGLLVDWVTALGLQDAEPQLSLLTAENPRLGRHPPAHGGGGVTDVGRSLPLGVVGALSVSGAVATDVHGLASWSLPDAWRG